MTVDQFANALNQFGENLRNIDNELLEIGGQLVADLKQAAPRDSGALRNSIQAVIENNQLQIAMLEYGVFQNYGVDGTKQRVARDVPAFGIDPMPRDGHRTYSFGTDDNVTMISGRGNNFSYGVRTKIYQEGLRPQNWFDLDALTDALTNEIEQRREI